jgi:hypothetical protein
MGVVLAITSHEAFNKGDTAVSIGALLVGCIFFYVFTSRVMAKDELEV